MDYLQRGATAPKKILVQQFVALGKGSKLFFLI